jgi:hypothetical protein
MILKCNCKHEHQDQIHGKNMRVHTTANKGWRCTVCNSMTPFPADMKKK